MGQKPIFVSYCTPSYIKMVNERLIPSFKRWGLGYSVHFINSLGSWQKNTCYKASFILQQLLTFRNPIIWIDADAEVRQYPALLVDDDAPCMSAHFGAHHRIDALGRRLSEYPDDGELLGGTLFFANVPEVHLLVARWICLNEERPGVWEQKNLQRALREISLSSNSTVLDGFVRVIEYELPAEYCMIVGGGRAATGTLDQAVVAHYQASRQFRSSNG